MRPTASLTLICLMQILSNTNATKGKYTVIAPGTIHCNENYTAAVAVHHTTQRCRIKVGITGSSYEQFKEVVVEQNQVKHVEFFLPCLEEQVDLNLTAEGIRCLDNFKNTTKLIYKKFNNHVIIQTDKNLYAPGDEIKFRVLFLDKDLRPAEPEKDATIWFEDGKLNRIKEITNFKTSVYTGKLEISEFPVLGDWHLRVKNADEFDHMVHFKVDKYILPKFVVKVEATKSASVKDGDMQVVVRANYNYGKPLEGKVNVVLLLETNNYYEYMKPPILGKAAKIINGNAKFDFNIKEYEANLLPSYMNIVAMVEEKFTGVKINGTTSTTIYPFRYSMNCINYDASSVDNEKNVLLQITHIDGSYLNDTLSTIQLIYKEFQAKNNWSHRPRTLDDDSFVPSLSENHTFVFKGNMNESGFVNFKVALPDLPHYEGYSHYYSLELKYLDEQREVCNTYLYWYQKQVNSRKKTEDKSKEYFTLEKKYWWDDKLYVKKTSQFVLNSSQPLSYFDYNIIGRGNILESARVEFPGTSKINNLTLTPQFSWAPSFCVYVNYVDANGQYHYAEQQYEVVFEMENQINVTVANRVKPGKEVALKIETAPNSFVGLTAVDQTVFQLGNGNDINFHELSKILGSYKTYSLRQNRILSYPGKMSGCVTLTNADYLYSSAWTKNKKGDFVLEPNEEASMYNTAGETTDATNSKNYKDFSQTWLFTNIEKTEASKFIWIEKIPETLTSWALTAFSLNPQKGLGVTSEQTKITTFLPFFISIPLPYSIKRGEVINVPAWVFNYLDKALNVEVILHNSDYEYEFIKFNNEVVNEQKLSKSIRVPANGAAGIYFLIKPKAVGYVMLNLNVVSPVTCDTIHKSIRVVPEGITQYANSAYFVNLKNESEFQSSFEFILPQNFVADTGHVEVGVMGDILGPVLNNVDNLVRVPTACGEQTMSRLLPFYMVMKYLKDTKRLAPTMKKKLSYNLEIGYQSILNYRHTDGSFSSFGPAQIKEKHPNGSTWLTAYVVRSLQQIKEFINVDGKIIEEGLDYLSKQQAADGSFTEHADYFYAFKRDNIAVTCFAVLAIMENATYAAKYSEELHKGLDFISQNNGNADYLHDQAMGTFTLSKAKYDTAQYEIEKLKDLYKTESNHIWWSAEKQTRGLFSSDVEITSYVLLTLLKQNSTKIDDVLPIVNWLIAQRNSYGGFVATQDTVVGLTALIEFSKLAKYKSAKMRVDIESQEKKEIINLTEDNGNLYQYIEMPPDTRSINFTAKGTGSVLVQVAYQYNVYEKDLNTSFIIKTAKMYNKNMPQRVYMLVCVYYVGEGYFTNMAILEISTPSGYVIDDESLKEVKELKRVLSTELKFSDTLLVVYFDHLQKNDGVCFLIEIIRTHAVAMQKPASIVMYDYYEATKKATAFYEVEVKLCDICETKLECSKCT